MKKLSKRVLASMLVFMMVLGMIGVNGIIARADNEVVHKYSENVRLSANKDTYISLAAYVKERSGDSNDIFEWEKDITLDGKHVSFEDAKKLGVTFLKYEVDTYDYEFFYGNWYGIGYGGSDLSLYTNDFHIAHLIIDKNTAVKTIEINVKNITTNERTNFIITLERPEIEAPVSVGRIPFNGADQNLLKAPGKFKNPAFEEDYVMIYRLKGTETWTTDFEAIKGKDVNIYTIEYSYAKRPQSQEVIPMKRRSVHSQKGASKPDYTVTDPVVKTTLEANGEFQNLLETPASVDNSEYTIWYKVVPQGENFNDFTFIKSADQVVAKDLGTYTIHWWVVDKADSQNRKKQDSTFTVEITEAAPAPVEPQPQPKPAYNVTEPVGKTGLVENGQALNLLEKAATIDDNEYTIWYKVVPEGDNFNNCDFIKSADGVVATKAGTYTIHWWVVDKTNHQDKKKQDSTIEVTIAKEQQNPVDPKPEPTPKYIVIDPVGMTGLVENGQPLKLLKEAASVKENNDYTIWYKVVPQGENFNNCDFIKSADDVVATNAGTYTIHWWVVDKTNHQDRWKQNSTIDVVIAKKAPVNPQPKPAYYVTEPVAKTGLVENGQALNLLEKAATIDNENEYTIWYKVVPQGENFNNCDFIKSADGVVATKAGTYTIHWWVIDKTNYQDKKKQDSTIEVTIAKEQQNPVDPKQEYTPAEGAPIGEVTAEIYKDGTGSNPTPVNPTPVNPTPVNPTPVNPTPVNPTPVNPTPAPVVTPDPEPAPTEETNINEPETPLDETPEIEETEEPKTSHIVENEVAKSDKPVVAQNNTIEDDATPLSDSPLTGDALPIAWAGLGLFALAGIGGITLIGKKKR